MPAAVADVKAIDNFKFILDRQAKLKGPQQQLPWEFLIHVVNRQSFHWGMELAFPWGPLAAFVLVVLALSTLIAIASGRQAMGADVVRAVKEDW